MHCGDLPNWTRIQRRRTDHYLQLLRFKMSHLPTRILTISSISVNLAKSEGARRVGDKVESQLAIRDVVIRGEEQWNAATDGAPMAGDKGREGLNARSRRASGVLQERADAVRARDLLAVVVKSAGIDGVDECDK